MSFITGLSGLRGSKTHLDAVGNNVANAGTTAFKKSRVEFADVYSANYLSSGKTEVGSGVAVERVAQLKNQGHVALTNKPLDLGIKGRGHFITEQNGTILYTRDGTFRINKDGFITDNTGAFLQGYGLDENGNKISSLNKIYVPQTNLVGKATTHADIEFNLNHKLPVVNLETTEFDPKDPDSYSYSNVTKLYDSMGGEHDLQYYFVKTGQFETPQEAARNGINNATLQYPMTTWTVFTALDKQLFDAQGNTFEPHAGDQARNAQFSLAYDSNGLLQGVSAGGLNLIRDIPAATPPNDQLHLISGTGTGTISNAQPPNAGGTPTPGRWRDGVITVTSNVQLPASPEITGISGPGFSDTAGGELQIVNNGATPPQWTLTLVDGTDQVGTAITTSTANGTAVFTKPNGDTYRINYANLAATNNIALTDQNTFTYVPNDTGVPEIANLNGNTLEFYGGAGDPRGFTFDVNNIDEFHNGATYQLNTEGTPSPTSTLAGFSANHRLTFNMANLTPGATYGRLDNNNIGSDRIEFRFSSTQTSTDSNFSSVIQDGYPPGVIKAIGTSKDGVLSVHYTNNQTKDIAKVPLATFRSEDNLMPVGSNAYVETKDSGVAIINDATAGPNGEIEDQSLELSNVDLAEELVQMIIAQRNFQANAKTIQTEDAITQTVINLR